MSELTKWIFTVLAALLIAAIVGLWKLVASRASRSEVVKIAEVFDADIKALNLRVDQFVLSLSGVVSKTDLLRDLTTASTRVDDKDLRVQRDIAELKADMKATIEKLAAVDKKLDELPTRVASLETTRNQQGRNNS